MESLSPQRRCLLSFESRRLPHIFTDVLVIGCGIAGLRAAIEASNYGQVILLSKGEMPESNSYYAQGGMAAVTSSGDSIDKHIADTLATGCGMSDEDVVRYTLLEAPRHVEQVRQWGVDFDSQAGQLSLAREGGHSEARILHAAGDATGRVLSEVLISHVRRIEAIKVFEECFAIDLLTEPESDSPCLGVVTYHNRYGLQIIRAKQTILAAGGAGVLWRETSNPPNATADGIAMAFRAGVALADMEMMQFHPTTLYVAGGTRSLISEAVRGEGAYLVDQAGQRFMVGQHEMAELAPRDVVSRAIMKRMAETNYTHVFLDVRHLGGKAFAQRFPQIDAKCRAFGIDPGKDLIPVHPAAHYMIGGARTDMDGRTSLGNLLACGEAACSGLHGANRLASNSLTEALVFGQKCGQTAGESLAANGNKLTAERIDYLAERSDRTELDMTDVRNSLRSVMWRNVGVSRRGERLAETMEIVSFWGRYVLDKELFDPAGWEVQNMLTAAYVITRGALSRTETRGVHCREDFPEADPAWLRHQMIRRVGQQLIIE